ncbi:MAG: NAD(P)H-dependent oxidoreductase [Christensenellaceae bacterium]
MKILVLNGSPKGKNSITLQTVRYIQKKFEQDQFEILHVGQQIKKLSDAQELQKCMQKMDESDLVLFCYPVYTFGVPYQLHKLIELLKEHSYQTKAEFATQITTSKHFYDVTAHRFMQENCYDFGFSVMEGLSADMDDLLTPQGRADALAFFGYVHFCVEKKIATKKNQVKKQLQIYQSSAQETAKIEGSDTVIVTNMTQQDVSLRAMVDDFIKIYPYPVRVINIDEFAFAGGCLGCFACATNGECVYKDGFDRFLREKIQTAQCIIFAAAIKDHFFGASFKQYDDRQFCNGHRTVTMGMPVGYILSGAYSQEPNLQMIIEGRCEVGGNFLAGVACDEGEDTLQQLQALSDKTVYALQNKLTLPQNFLGVGGTKIFRDLIYVMRGLMKEDHRFYKKHKIYDFPQKKIGTILKMQMVGMLMSIPAGRKKMKTMMGNAIIKPYQKAIDENEKGGE